MFFSFIKSNTLCLVCESLVNAVEGKGVPDNLKPYISSYFELLIRKGMYNTYDHYNEDMVKYSLDFF